MDFKEIGEILRQQREEQGWSLEDIHQKIKISPSCLQNIEQGFLDELPHPVYVKGFIKNYAHFLGLDSEGLSREFAQNLELYEEEDEQGVEPEPILTSTRKRSSFWRLLSILVSLLLLLLLGYLVYDLLYTPAGQQSRQEAVSEEQAAPASNQDAAKQEAASEKGMQSAQAGLELEFEPLPVSARQQEEEAVSMLPEEAADQETKLATQEESTEGLESQALPEEQDQAQVLEISATEACWLQAVVDEETREIYLRPGESVSFKFWEELQLKLGNAGGVQLFYNDQEYPLQAESGEVKELSFP
jgi:cytoskeleton protein RodZ